MCGITGILGVDKNRSSQRNEIEGMISSLQHRGPDGWGVYLSEMMRLGQTRLSIVDIEGGSQPMATARYVIVYNGEVYNHIELREELIKKGVSFETHCDTEVVLKAFEVFEYEAFSKFNGQFAFIIWDKVEKRAVACRDRYGVRPLYVLHQNSKYYFASELKSFDLIDGFQREINIENLFEHALLWNTLGDRTIYNNVRSLPAGTFEIYKQGEPAKNYRYYEIGESEGDSPKSFNEAKQEFGELLEDSVKLRLRSDVPVAAYLSGGIDSSVITYLTSKNSSKKFKTFSVTFEDKEFDESNFQHDMAERINCEYINQHIDYKAINDNFENAAYHFERPVFRTAPVPLYLLSKKVNEDGIKVVLTGEAADEILYGYDSFKEIMMLKKWREDAGADAITALLKKLYPHLMYYADEKKIGLMRMYYEGFLNDFDNDLVSLNIRVQNNSVLANYLNKDHKITFNKEKLIGDVKKILPPNFSSWSLLKKNQFLEMKTLLSGYLLSSQGDRMSMAHSVEGRYPFLDHRLVEKIFYYNDDYKLNDFTQKFLLSETFKHVIPESIINRPKKPYTAPDLKSFFYNGGLSENAAYYLSDNKIDEYGIFDKKFTSRLIKKFSVAEIQGIGYRDNMVISFILSTQMILNRIKNPAKGKLDYNLKRVEIIE